jgi:hypothetical protein
MLIKILNLLLINGIIQIGGIDFYKEELIRGDKTYKTYKFNIYHHLSGISPYFESNNEGLNPNIPEKCQIDKTSYLIRHGSIYVDDYDYYHVIKHFLKRLKKSINFTSKLSFLSKWKSPFFNEKEKIEKLTRSGILESYELGVQLSYRYSKLLSKQNKSSFHIWTSSSERTKQTALAIFHGLFPGQISNNEIISIPEEKNRGANSLTPTKTCQKFHSSKGSKEAMSWLKSYTKPILKRFNSISRHFNFVPNDILAMQELCGYETVIRGNSPFCSLFTSEEWIYFEYYFDIKYHYEIGYGNDLSPYLGIHWIKSMIDIFNNKILSNQNIYISVAHREMIPVVLVSLGLYNQSEYIQGKSIFTLNEINFDRLWKSSQLIPFLARIQLELFSCSSIDFNGSFVRILVNSLPRPLPGCSQGPDGSCPLQLFTDYIHQRYLQYKNFSKACQIDQNNTSDHLTFFQNDSS